MSPAMTNTLLRFVPENNQLFAATLVWPTETLYCLPPLLITANMTFVILLSHPRAESDSNGYVEGMGGEPFALFRYPEITHSCLFSKLRREVYTWLSN